MRGICPCARRQAARPAAKDKDSGPVSSFEEEVCSFVWSLAAAIGALVIIGVQVANVEPRSHDAGSPLVPRLVSRTLPAVVSITTRQIEHIVMGDCLEP